MLSLIGILIGVGLASQTAINSRLRAFVGSPLLATLTSFAVGTCFLALALLVFGRNVTFPAGLSQEPFWIWIGGICGVSFLTANILLFPRLGAVETTVLPLLGQIVIALAIDHFAWFGASPSPMNRTRFLGVLILLIGLFLSVAYSDLLQRHPRLPSNCDSSPWSWRALGLGAGVLVGIQLAINAELGRVLDSQVHAAFISFLVGTLTLLLLVSLVDRSFQALQDLRGQRLPPWIFLGGILGSIYVLVNVFLVDAIGTGRTVVAVLFGQITASLLIQAFGLFQSDQKDIPKVKFLGLALMLVGVVLVQ